MKCKKFLSVLLAGSMLAAMSVSAFASTGNTDTSLTQSTNVTGTTQAPTIKINVPTTGAVTVNPYKMAVTPDGGTETKDQIISAPFFIKSNTDLPLKVNVATTATITGNLKLATASTAGGKVTTNSVFMYVEGMPATDGSTAPTWATAYDATKHVVVAAKGTAKPLGEIEKAATDTDKFFAVHLAGDAVSAPSIPWATTDKVDVALTFTFVPVMETAASAG